jgi:hypothetical protein
MRYKVLHFLDELGYCLVILLAVLALPFAFILGLIYCLFNKKEC